MTYLDYFPSKFDAPTEVQVEMLKRIEEIVNTGTPNIILCAPTGSGKSAIGMTFARARGTSAIITTQKILQNQYKREFPWGYSLKGKNNFLCLDLWDSDKISLENAFLEKDLRCDKGVCRKIEKVGNKIKYVDCEYKPDIGEFFSNNQGTELEKIQGPKDMCTYYSEKYAALHASHTIFNYYSFFQTINSSQSFEHFLDKKCLIADEAHEIEDNIISFLKLNIPKSYLNDSNLDISKYSIANIDQALLLITDLIKEYEEQVTKLEANKADSEKIDFLNKRIKRINLVWKEINNNPENFILESENSTNKFTELNIKPIDVNDYAKKYFDYPFQLFMSATINKEMFCKNMGFDEKDCEFIEIKKSPFKPINRKIEFLDIARLSGANAESDFSTVHKKINELIELHSNEKGLVLTTSKNQCTELMKALSMEMPTMDSWKRMKIVHNDIEEDKEEIVTKHGEISKKQVLLSPSLWYGVDLKDDLSRFQIILKTPYQYFGDARIKIKANRDRKWYKYNALVQLLQGFGRSVRNKDDYAVTYVIDTTSLELIKEMKEYVPKSFHDILPLE